MSASMLLEVEVPQDKSGCSVVLREEIEEPSSGWPSKARALHSDLIAEPVVDFEAVRAVAQRRSLLSRAGGGLTIRDVATRLGVQEQDVERLRANGRLLAVPGPGGEGWLYPACQFVESAVLPGLDEVIGEFTVNSAWTQLYVLISNDPALSGRSPVEALKDGDIEAARQVVQGYGEQGAG